MKKSFYTVLFSCLLIGCSHLDKVSPTIKKSASEAIEYRVIPFQLSDVELLDGPFKKSSELNEAYILNYEPDRLLSRFRQEAGLKPRAEQYGGWESESLAGHTLGHYLTACAQIYSSTEKEEFLKRVNYIVAELKECQEADKDYYIGAFPNGKRIFETEIAQGEIRAQSFDLNGIWAPFYTMHKVMGGLRDAYRLTNNEQALIVESRFADWIEKILRNLKEEEIQEMLNCEHGGMNEALAELAVDTGNDKYMQLAQKFYHKSVLDPLAEHRDILPGIHGNTQIPKLIGLARLFELEGNKKDSIAACYFWDRVVNHHSYVTGGHGNFEYFGRPDTLRDRLSEGTTETCNVYNMLKLSEHLFEWNPSAVTADYYERALFNQILSTQSAIDGRLIYNQSLEMGGYKDFQDPMYFTCCIGTGMENHGKHNGNIYFYNNEELFVSQYIASKLDWKEKGVQIIQMTKYPEEHISKLEFNMDEPLQLKVYLRHPSWLADDEFTVLLNGQSIRTKSKAGSFFVIDRKWSNGDKLTIEMPFSLRLESMPDDTNRVAVMYGPLVMAGILDGDSLTNDKPFEMPILLTQERDPNKWLIKDTSELNTFRTSAVGSPFDFLFIPLYKIHDQRYSVYFDMYTAMSWAQHIEELNSLRKIKEQIEELATDFYDPSDPLSEKEHRVKGDMTEIVNLKTRKARHANRGGYFQIEMTVDQQLTPSLLLLEYWGGYTGSKTFDIIINNQKIATENISGKKDGHFIDIAYPIPPEITENNKKLTIQFLPHVGHRAGPVFSARILSQEAYEKVTGQYML